MSEQQNTRIVGLKIRNVKRLTAIDYQPDPKQNVIGVGGKNAAGKTSMLDSIMYALGGTKNIPAGVVREGAKKAEIEIELDDFIVKRVIGKGAKLEITSKEKGKFSSPQTLLDEMVGKLTFDPLRFQRLCETPAGRREQAELLRQLVGLDFTELDQKRAGVFSERTEVNRELKRVISNLEAAPSFSDVPKEAISVADLSKRLEEAVQHNRDGINQRDLLERHCDNITGLEQEIVDAGRNLENLKAELQERQAQKKKIHAEANYFLHVDETGLREQIEGAELTNDKIRKNVARDTMLREQDKLQKSSDKLDSEIEALDESKVSQLAGAKMPVENLAFSEDAVLYNGKSFENCSSAEQLRVSVAMSIAMNPKLRVMLIRDGSLLDKNSRKLLREMAEAANQQIWIEFVDRNEECSVIIEDGMMLDMEPRREP